MTHEERCKAWAWLQDNLLDEPPWPLCYIKELQDGYIENGDDLRAENARLERELQIESASTKMLRLQYEGAQTENARLTAAHEAAADELARVVQELREAREALWVSEAAKHLAPIMGNAATAYASDLQKIYGKDYSPQEAVEEDQTYWEAKE